MLSFHNNSEFSAEMPFFRSRKNCIIQFNVTALMRIQRNVHSTDSTVSHHGNAIKAVARVSKAPFLA